MRTGRVAIVAAAIAVISGILLSLWPAGAQELDQDPARSDLVLELDEFARLPMTAGSRMMELTFAPGVGDQLFVTVQEGQIWRLSRSGAVAGTPFLDLATTNLAPSLRPSPLRYLAFHPDYNRPGTAGFGKLYTTVSLTRTGTPDDDTDDLAENSTGDRLHAWVVVEWTVPAPATSTAVDPASGREVLRLHYRTPAGGPHGLNDLAFDPTLGPGHPDYGLLYISSGDNGDGVVGVDGPYAQRRDNLFGKILRIDPLASGAQRYTIPATNPFVGVGGARGEIYATGLRNPQNLSFETLAGTSALVASDIGYDSAEEVNVIVAGANYGWDAFEGPQIENSTPVVGPERLRNPVAYYDHTLPSNQIDAPAVRVDGSSAIVGGAIYRGTRAPRFIGQYVFGDIPRGRFFHVGEAALAAAHASGNPAPVEELLVHVDGAEVLFAQLIGSSSGRGDARFGRDQAGELYVLNKTDRIIRRLAIGPPVPPPTPTPTPGPTVTPVPTPTPTPTPDGPAVPDPSAPTPSPDPTTRPTADQPIVLPPGQTTVPVPGRCRDMGPLNPIVGTSGADDLVGTPGNDLILGLGGSDRIRGRGGDDCIVGGSGRDRAIGGAGNDRLLGARGNDVLRGGSGDDRLVGGAGVDRCRGGIGSDTLRRCEGPTIRR